MERAIENRLTASGDNIIINEKAVNYNELFDLSVVKKIESEAEKFYFDSPFVNEIYRDFLLPYICIDKYLSSFDIEVIDVRRASESLKGILLDYANDKNIRVFGKFNTFIFKSRYKLTVFCSFIFLFFKLIKIRKQSSLNTHSETVSFCRTPASYKKITKIINENVLYETTPGVGDVYKQVSKFELIKCLFNALPKGKQEIKKLKSFLTGNCYKKIYICSLSHYKKRIIHTFFYENVVEKIIENNNFKIFITGNNLDRFAVIEEKLAKKYSMKLVCIPHGIEYGYRFPKCFIGDEFYATSEYAAQWLNRLYHTKKFLYNPEIVKNMFKVDYKSNQDAKVVFFSEPREPEVSIGIIDQIAQLLSVENIKLYVKLHPKDDKNLYNKVIDCNGIEIISDINLALCGNICIARKSTTLIEALSNGSKAYAIVTNEKDRCIYETFPSLHNPEIKYFEDVALMVKDILKNFKPFKNV